jgi:hypothetical protein
MNLVKTSAVVVGSLVIAVAVADLGWGNTTNPVLPAFLGNNLTQNLDLFLILLAVTGIFITVNYA